MRRMCRSCNIPSTHHNPWQLGTLLSKTQSLQNPILSYLSCVHFRRFLMEGDDVRPGPRRTYLPRGLLSSSVYESTLTQRSSAPDHLLASCICRGVRHSASKTEGEPTRMHMHKIGR